MKNNVGNIYRSFALLACLAAGLTGSALAQQDVVGLTPTIDIVSPTGWTNTGFKLTPTDFTLTVQALDADAPDGRAVRYRYLIKPAIYGGGTPIQSQYDFNNHWFEVLSLGDPAWSAWAAVPPAPDDIAIPIAGLNDGDYYLISIQVLDQDGASNNPFVYQRSALHIKAVDGVFTPVVALMEQFLGTSTVSAAEFEIAAGQPLNFAWLGDASAYGGEIASYRHGWDLVDVDDPNDPGWAVPAGLEPQNLYATEHTFQSGVHTFTLRVEDNLGGTRILSRTLRVVPFISPEYQLELLVLDQIVDANVNNWLDQSGDPRNDEDYRNPWWHFLAESPGGVVNFDWGRDWRNHTDDVQYSDLVQYKTVLCYAEANSQQRMFSQFRPQNGADKYVWLAPYQQQGGNLFLVGGTSMESFLEQLPNYMTPVIFESEQTTHLVNAQEYVVGFGEATFPDGRVVMRGPRMYPFATAGIAALDWTSPNTKYIYNRPYTTRFDRTVDCAGLKGLVLDSAFKSHFLIGPGVIADTLWTDPEIDWHDVVDAQNDSLNLFSLNFPFRADEFVDADIGPFPRDITPQDCVYGPGGQCIEPMFRGISRFDYMREYYWDKGETDWPSSRYTDGELDDGCGPVALTDYQGTPRRSALTNGQTYGYLSYKSVANKPSGKPDVYWGFDPYRFDQAEAGKAVRWVLGYFGLQISQ